MNSTDTNATTTQVESETLDSVFQVFWLIGIVVSFLCIGLQAIFFVFIRCSRKIDEKILAQITITRILVTLCEYYIMYVSKTILLIDIIFGIYFTSDFALVCLMVLFSLNLYAKIVIVFCNHHLNLIYSSIIVWAISLMFGFAGIYILKYHIKYFEFYCKLIFGSTKFCIVSFNLLIYCRIFYVAFRRGNESNRNIVDTMKTAFVAFLLVTTTSLQILITDLIAYGKTQSIVLEKSFCVMNSFHAVPITVIFIIVLKSKMRDSIINTMQIRLTQLVT